MARTRASVGAKVSSGKSSKARCSAAPPPASVASSGGDRKGSSSGGNPVCPRDTPAWQKPIAAFFTPQEKSDNGAGPSKPKSKKRNIIESDEETSPVKNNKENTITVDVHKENAENAEKQAKLVDVHEENPENEEKSSKQAESVDENEESPEVTEENGEDSQKTINSDDFIVLEELSGENSHKLEEYYPKKDNKVAKGKENMGGDKKIKRDREEGIEEGNSSKKIKIH